MNMFYVKGGRIEFKRHEPVRKSDIVNLKNSIMRLMGRSLNHSKFRCIRNMLIVVHIWWYQQWYAVNSNVCMMNKKKQLSHSCVPLLGLPWKSSDLI